jgi:dolichol-phosphate mannosyltransferase
MIGLTETKMTESVENTLDQAREDKAPDLSVVIPVHNESANISNLIEEVAASLLGQIEFELIVVDDFSSDDTTEIIQARSADRPWLHLCRHARNAGQSTAVLTGVRRARAHWIATLDGDGQNDPADIPAMWRMHLNEPGFAMICGHRQKRRDTYIKRLSSRIANAVRSRLLADDTPDTGCGLKLFSREGFLAVPHFDHLHRFLPALVRRQGGTITSVAVNHRPRGGGSSHYGIGNRLWVGIIDMIGVMWLKRRPVNAELLPNEDKRNNES